MEIKKPLLILQITFLFVILSACNNLYQQTLISEKEQENCVLPSGFRCDEFKVEPNKVMVKVTNTLGYDLILSGVRLGDEYGKCVTYPGTILNNGESYTAVLETECQNGEVGTLINKRLYLAYHPVDSESSDIIVNGTITTKVMPFGTITSNGPNSQMQDSAEQEGYLFSNGAYYTKDDCEFVWYGIQKGEITIDEKERNEFLGYMEFCYGKRELPRSPQKEYSHKINIIEPKISYDCNRLDLSKADEETIRRCKLYNYCDKIEPYDVQVRKSSSNAIEQHPGSYSTRQIIDVYKWAKDNIFYQNVPLNEYPPYRPSETIFTGSGDCKNYGAVISSMILSIGGSSRIATIPSCRHAFAEVFIGGQEQLDLLSDQIKELYQQDIEINAIKDSEGYWLILDGAGASYPGTTNIDGCLDTNAKRYLTYSCVKSDGTINKQSYEKEEELWTFTEVCDRCSTKYDCEGACNAYCIEQGWGGSKSATGYETKKNFGLTTEVSCTCNCFKSID
jgi:hypothetical protein